MTFLLLLLEKSCILDSTGCRDILKLCAPLLFVAGVADSGGGSMTGWRLGGCSYNLGGQNGGLIGWLVFLLVDGGWNAGWMDQTYGQARARATRSTTAARSASGRCPRWWRTDRPCKSPGNIFASREIFSPWSRLRTPIFFMVDLQAVSQSLAC